MNGRVTQHLEKSPILDTISAMLRRIAFAVVLTIGLTGCSYVYTIRATGGDGRVTFVIDQEKSGALPCLRRIEVRTLGGETAQIAPGDTFWFESRTVADGCANSFPVVYGAPLAGASEAGRTPVAAKPLLRNVAYEVLSTTGSTGYGKGRFIIRSDGRVDNLDAADAAGSKAAS